MPMTISDKISNLPDAVVCHILSFLPTKLAAATSILSKRWTRLWLSVPTLHLVEKRERDEELDLNRSIQFLRMVYAVMLKRDMTHIKTFSLKITTGHTLCDASDVSTWINAAIHRGVESLHLDLLPTIRLPSGIIGSKTLVYLSFFHLTINGVFSGGFPSLKVMRLMLIHFEQHRDLMQLLSCCPILEDLYAKGLVVNNDGLVSVEEFHSSIHNLVRANVSFAATYIPFKCLCNAKTLSLMEWFPNYEVACTFHNLTSLELMFGSYNWHWFLNLLQHCPKLQSFKLVKLESADEDDEWVQPQFVPGCLSSHLRTCDLENYEGFDSELLHFAKYIMQNAKVLCNMIISGGIFSNQQAKLNFIKELSSFPWSSSELYLNVM